MKKNLLLALTVALCVGVSTTCFAGFGLPKVPGASKESKETKLTTTAETVDLGDLMEKQKAITALMIACNNDSVKGWVALHNATGNDVSGILTAQGKMNETMSAEDGDSCTTAISEAAKNPIDQAKVAANAAKVKEAIAQAKLDKVNAENSRTKAATLLPGATGEIAKATKQALKDFDFAKRFNPVKKAFNLNKKMLTTSDKNLKAMNAHIAKLEEALKKANA